MKRFILVTVAALTSVLPVFVRAALPVTFMDPVINQVPNLTFDFPRADDSSDVGWLVHHTWVPVRFDFVTALDARPRKPMLMAAASNNSQQPWPQPDGWIDRMKSAVLADSRIRPRGMAGIVHRKNRDKQRGSKRLWRSFHGTRIREPIERYLNGAVS